MVLDRIRYAQKISPIDSPSLVENEGDKWHGVYGPVKSLVGPSINFGDIEIDFGSLVPDEIPEMGVAVVQQATLVSKHGWVFDRKNRFLHHHSWYSGCSEELTKNHKLPRFSLKKKRQLGTCLSLCSDFSVGGYGHFVTDCLARLHLFFKAGFKFSDVDKVFIARPLRGNAEVLFNQLNLPIEKCIWVDGNKHTSVETLIVPSFPGTRRNYPKWVPEYLREQLLSKGESAKNFEKRIFVARTGYARNPNNESELMEIAREQGFSIYDPMRHDMSHQDFKQAEVVVGVSGSALTGLAFCTPGAKVLEIISSDHIYPYYCTLSHAAGLHYHYLVGKADNQREKGAFGPSCSNFYIPPGVFEDALRVLVGPG